MVVRHPPRRRRRLLGGPGLGHHGRTEGAQPDGAAPEGPRPEQREGRIIRQGNTNEKVQIFTYVMERTFDSYSYQILENKQRFISQINRGDLTIREAEDIDETTLSYAEIKAITAANPKIKRKMEVDAEVARLRVLEGQYRKNLYDLQDKIYKTYPEEIRKQELLIERIGKDLEMLKTRRPADPEAFEIGVNGKVYTDKNARGGVLRFQDRYEPHELSRNGAGDHACGRGAVRHHHRRQRERQSDPHRELLK